MEKEFVYSRWRNVLDVTKGAKLWISWLKEYLESAHGIFPPSAITPDLFEIFLEGSATATVSTYPHEGRTPGSPDTHNHTRHTLLSDVRLPQQIFGC